MTTTERVLEARSIVFIQKEEAMRLSKPDLKATMTQEATMTPFEFVGSGEVHDCTVRAVASALGVSYARAHDALAAQGRKAKRGATKSQWLAAIAALGYEARRVDDVPPRTTVKRTIRDFTRPGGRYIVQIRSHAFAVLDRTVAPGEYWTTTKWVKSLYEIRPSR